MVNDVATPRHAPDGLILAMACIAQFMVVLDVSIVNVALPYIQSDLGFTQSGIQWIVNAYVLAFAGFLLLGGRAADLFGRRRTYLFGLTVFTLASAGAGFAATEGQLIAARAIQGFAAAILSPATLTIILTTFRGPRLPRAIGAWSAVAGGGGAVGVLIGGVLVSYANWRWIFFINIPFGIIAGVVAIMFLREMRNKDALVKLDVVGSVLVTISLTAFVYAIVNGPSNGWGSTTTLAWMGGAVVGLAAFVWWELREASHPVLPFRLFRSRALFGADLIMLLIGGAFFAMWYFLSFYLNRVLGYDAIKTGLAFAPMSLAIVLGAQISSRLVARVSVRPLVIAGTLMGAAGFFWLSMITPSSSYWATVLPASASASFAMGVLFTPLTTAATSHVAPADAGVASGVLNTARQVGGAFGLAILTTIAATQSNTFANPQSPEALTSGYQSAFFCSSLVMFAAFATSFVLPGHIGRRLAHVEAAAGAH